MLLKGLSQLKGKKGIDSEDVITIIGTCKIFEHSLITKSPISWSKKPLTLNSRAFLSTSAWEPSTKFEMLQSSAKTASTNSCRRVYVSRSSVFKSHRRLRCSDNWPASLWTSFLTCLIIVRKAQSPSDWTLSSCRLNVAKCRLSVSLWLLIVGSSVSMLSSEVRSFVILLRWTMSRALKERSLFFSFSLQSIPDRDLQWSQPL